jgi:hypothetical protein
MVLIPWLVDGRDVTRESMVLSSGEEHTIAFFVFIDGHDIPPYVDNFSTMRRRPSTST